MGCAVAVAALRVASDVDGPLVCMWSGIGWIWNMGRPSTPTWEGTAPMNRDVATTDSEASMQSWGYSIALHGFLWGLGVWVISQQAIAPTSTFQWEVSLVSPSRESSGQVPSSGALSQSHDRIGSVVTKPIRTSAAALSARSEIQAEPVVREAVRSNARAEGQSVVAMAVPTPAEVDDSTVSPSRDLAATPQTLVEPQNAVDNATQGPPASDVQSVVAAEHPADGSSDSPTDVVLASANATQAPSVETSPDFGWLMQMLWSRVMELKHYPPEARMNRLEGRVVVRVVIDEQGRLLDATIATGSGHALLDHAALDVIRRSCPLSLPKALGRHQIVLRVPIQYRLDS